MRPTRMLDAGPPRLTVAVTMLQILNPRRIRYRPNRLTLSCIPAYVARDDLP